MASIFSGLTGNSKRSVSFSSEHTDKTGKDDLHNLGSKENGNEENLSGNLKFPGPPLKINTVSSENKKPYSLPLSDSGRHFAEGLDSMGKTLYGTETDKFDDLTENYKDNSVRGAQEFARRTTTNSEVRNQVKAVMDNTESLQRPRIARKLAIAYTISIIVVIVLSLAGQLVVQFATTRSYKDGEIVNISGRQRMYCQLIAKDSLAIMVYIQSNETASFYEGELREKLKKWKESQHALWYGNGSLGIPGTTKKSIIRNFEISSKNFEAILIAGERILSLNLNNVTADELSILRSQVRIILDNENPFWTRQDIITKQFERLARQHLEFVLIISWVLHSLVILTLLLEGMFLFRPALRKIQALINERFTLIRRTLEAEAASGGVSLLMMAYIRNELLFSVDVVTQNMGALRALLRPHAERELVHDFVLDGIRLDCRGAMDDLNESDVCIGLMKTVISDVANVTQVSAGRMSLAMDFTDIVGIVQQAVRIAQRKAFPGVSVEVDMDQALLEEPVYQVDKHRLQQVLINLVIDAFRVTVTGSVVVRARPVEGNQKLHFEVEDGGGGLSQEEEAFIFQPVLVGESNKEGKAKDGQNISRYFVKMLVELQGGTIDFEVKEGRGTSFWFEIPASHGGALGLQVVNESAGAPGNFGNEANYGNSINNQNNLNSFRAEAPIRERDLSSILARDMSMGYSGSHHFGSSFHT